ncbi:sperm acrosome membrane-associated protein 6 isoform X2 [Antennarius striatus]|uniref:sperm acrosome membrane-associated protein 6 isoform X2 n=1 Tax=Antennarius striatus TaxID=241820 RepID=UPI0035B4AACF
MSPLLYHQEPSSAKGYDKQLKEIMGAEISSLLKEFHGKDNSETVYEERLQNAQDNFITAASKLPRGNECVPPCGFQTRGGQYNCELCRYDSCEFPMDCPFREMTVREGSSSQMWCNVSFQLPDDIVMIWMFSEQVKSQVRDQFKEMTSGLDDLYSIRPTILQDQGTYLCEILSGGLSIVRLYYYLTVTPRLLTGHSVLQDIFDQSVLSGHQFPKPVDPRPLDDGPPPLLSPLTLLLTAAFTSGFLLFFLLLGAGYFWATTPNPISHQEEEDPEDEFYDC